MLDLAAAHVSAQAELFDQASGRPLSTPADQTLQHRPDRLSMAAHRRLARRRVDQHGSAVRLKSHTYLGILPAEWRLGRHDQESRPAMRLTDPATITTPNRYDNKAWESTVPRIRRSPTVVSDT